jgi:hypothetical protein
MSLPWKNSLLAACLSMALAACASVRDTPEHALNTVEDNASGIWGKARSAMGVERKKKAVKSQPAYCYRSYQDVTCYAEPMPGEEDRLVAYQGSRGQTGYVLAEPARNQSTAPVSLPPLKAITVAPPPKIAAAPDPAKKPLKEIIFDPAELQPKDLVPQKPQ